jgi:hypothetical protein
MPFMMTNCLFAEIITQTRLLCAFIFNGFDPLVQVICVTPGAECIVQMTGLQKLNISQNPIDKNGAQAISKMSLIEVFMDDRFLRELFKHQLPLQH